MERLTAYKISKLDGIGFDWEIYSRHGWENQYNALVRFKGEYGHCRVKQRWEVDPALANWVSIQRRDRRFLTKEQSEKLDAIGFTWAIKPRKAKRV